MAQPKGREQWDGQRLKEIREARGFSQPELSKLAKVGVAEISRHESNAVKSNPTLAVLGRIAVALDVPLHVLMQPAQSEITRPEEMSGHAKRRGHNPVLEERFVASILEALDVEVPAEDSWRGDVLKAIAALNRALRRSDPGTVTANSKITRR